MPNKKRFASSEEWPDFSRRERQTIAVLQRRVEFLKSRDDIGYLINKEIEAFEWVIEYIGDESVAFNPIYFDTLLKFKEYWASRTDKNGWQAEELGAVSWVIREVQDAQNG